MKDFVTLFAVTDRDGSPRLESAPAMRTPAAITWGRRCSVSRFNKREAPDVIGTKVFLTPAGAWGAYIAHEERAKAAAEARVAEAIENLKAAHAAVLEVIG